MAQTKKELSPQIMDFLAAAKKTARQEVFSAADLQNLKNTAAQIIPKARGLT